jgi:hypothetical protein
MRDMGVAERPGVPMAPRRVLPRRVRAGGNACGRPEPVVPQCRTGAISRRGRAALPKRQRPLPVEIVAEVLVAIAGIEPETAVQRE